MEGVLDIFDAAYYHTFLLQEVRTNLEFGILLRFCWLRLWFWLLGSLLTFPLKFSISAAKEPTFGCGHFLPFFRSLLPAYMLGQFSRFEFITLLHLVRFMWHVAISSRLPRIFMSSDSRAS